MRGWRGEWLLAVCLVLLQLLVPIDCKGRLVDTRALSPPTRPLTSQVDDELVEHLWLSCGLDMRILEDVKNHFHYTLLFDIVRSSYGPAIKNASPPEIRIEEDTSGTLSPEVTHAFLNCLSKQNIPFGDTGRDDARSFLAQYVKSLFASRRRDLAQEPSATARSPTPAPSLPLTASPSTATQSAHLVPKSRSLSKPAKEPTESVLSPPPAEISHLKKAKHTPKSVAKKKNSNNMSTNTVIGLCVSGVALLALVCLCCCVCCTNRSAAYDSKDDKPLLSLSLSDFSGSSRNSYSHGTPIDINKLGALSWKSEAGHDSMKLSSHGNLLNAEGHPVVYNTSAEPPDASTSSVPGAKPPPPPVTPPPAHPKAPPPQAPKVAPGAPSGPHTQPAAKAGPPPPPPKSAGPPRPPPPTMPSSSKAHPPPRFKKEGDMAAIDAGSDAAKTKLKPFFWDKVAANPDQSMVWNHIKAGSFQFDEEMIENLFGYNTTDKKNSDSKKDISSKDAPQFVRILEPKKAQNLAISLKALSVSAEAVCSAVMEGNELPSELIQTLLRWTPTNDEELRLRLYTGEDSQLGPVEQYLRAIINVPYIFQRLEALFFMAILPEEAAHVKQSFATLEVACEELRNSRLFLKLLEAVLKTGNRMNVGTFRGGAHAFKLDTLLKLSDVKGTDGKTTLLHFVVQEIIRSEGVRAVRAAKEQSSSLSSVNYDGLTDDVVHETEDDYKQLGLKVVSSLGDELQNVRKAAGLDADALTISVASLGHKLVKTNEFLNTSMKSMDEDSGFHHKLKHFIEQSQADVTFLLEEEKRIRSLVRSTIDYFHGTTGKDEGLRLFVVVRDFLGMLDKVCKEVKEASKAAAKKPRTRQPSQSSPSFLDPRRNLFPAIQDRRADNSSSDEEH